MLKPLLLLFLLSDLRIQFILFKGPNSLNKHEARYVIKQARDIYITQTYDRRVRYKLAVRRGVDFSFVSISNQSDVFWQTFNISRRNRFCRRADICHAIIPPIKYQDRLWGTGAAKICSVGKSVNFGFSAIMMGAFELRAINTIGHELFHQLGARHHEGLNIMDPDANKYTKAGIWPLPVLEETRQEISLCQ